MYTEYLTKLLIITTANLQYSLPSEILQQYSKRHISAKVTEHFDHPKSYDLQFYFTPLSIIFKSEHLPFFKNATLSEVVY